MSNNTESKPSGAVDVPMEIEAKYVNAGFAPHQVKGKVLPGVYTKEYKDEGETEKGVITWDVKAFPEMSQIERIRGKFYLMRHGEMIDTADEFPGEMQELVLWANQYVADNKLLVKEINVRKEPAKEMTSQSAKNEASSTQLAVRDETSPETRVQTQTTVTVMNKNAPTAIRINGFDIPNNHIVWYATRKDGKLVGAKPYIDEKGLEGLAGRMGLWVDPRSSDPTFPIENLIPAIKVIPVKMPQTENEWGGKGDVVFKALVRMANGQIFEEYATANSGNLNSMQKKYPIENCITRAKARALRSATACNICSIEEACIETSGDKVLVRGCVPNQNGEIIDAEYTAFTVSSGGN